MVNDYGVPVLSCEYLDNRRHLINPIMRDFPDGMGKGTFIWEPSTYQHPLFDRDGNEMAANSSMDEYAKIARDYGLPVPSTPAAELEGTTCR